VLGVREGLCKKCEHPAGDKHLNVENALIKQGARRAYEGLPLARPGDSDLRRTTVVHCPKLQFTNKLNKDHIPGAATLQAGWATRQLVPPFKWEIGNREKNKKPGVYLPVDETICIIRSCVLIHSAICLASPARWSCWSAVAQPGVNMIRLSADRRGLGWVMTSYRRKCSTTALTDGTLTLSRTVNFRLRYCSSTGRRQRRLGILQDAINTLHQARTTAGLTCGS